MGTPDIKRKVLYRKVLDSEEEQSSKGYLFQEEYFNKDGELIRKSIYNELEEITRNIHYEYKGKKLVGERHEMESGVLKKDYRYENEELAEVDLSKNGDFQNRMIYTYQDDGQYDVILESNDRKVRQEHYDSQGRLQWEVNFTTMQRKDYNYDEQGELSSIREEHEEGHTIINYENRYDDQNRLIKVFINGNLSMSYSYNKHDLLEKELHHGLDGHIEEIKYEYQFY